MVTELACAVCGTSVTASDACTHCGEACCPDHRAPDEHDCPGTDAGRTGGWRVDLERPPDARRLADACPKKSAAHAGSERPGRDVPGLLHPGVGLALVTVILLAVSLGAVATLGPFDDELDAATVEDRIVERTDAERVAVGVGSTRTDAELATVARDHSRDMRDRGYVGHENPDGDGPGDRVRAAGLDCRPGENVYHAPRGALATSERALADRIVSSWLESAGHRETLLRERYDRQGVGVAIGAEGVYVTQLFC